MRHSVFAAAAAVILLAANGVQAERLTEEPLVDAAWVNNNLGDKSLVVLDIRPEGYEAAHIPGSVTAPYGKFGWRAKINGVVGMLPPVPEIAGRIGNLGIGNDKHVVIVPIGKSSSDFGAATRVYWTFKVLGHDAVSILDGGWRAWETAKGPVSQDAVSPQAVAFKADFQPALLATTDDVARAKQNGVSLVDARPAAQFNGEKKSGVVRVAGTIPGAVNIEQSSFYDGSAGAFVGKDSIAQLVKDAGVKEDADEIAFCNTGHWASVAWFGLSEVLGNKKTKMYDGSMTEWAGDPSRPVVAGQ